MDRGTIIAVTFLDGSVTSAGLGFIGLAHGVALLLAEYTIGRLTGAHIYPVVTIAHWATRRIETKKVAPYTLGQLAGASIAGFVQLSLWTSSNRDSFRPPSQPSLEIPFQVLDSESGRCTLPK